VRSGFANAFIYVHVCYYACSGLRVANHPIRLDLMFINSLASLFRFNDYCNEPTYPIAAFVKGIRASVRFLLVISNAAREFLRECQFKNAMVLESLESNAKLHHLALPTMLSALKHDWGILALFVVVN